MSIHPETLKLHRTLRHLSQADLATASKVSKKTISRIETGEAKPDGIRQNTVEGLAKALDITPEALARSPQADRQDARSVDDRLRSIRMRKIVDIIEQRKALEYELVAQRYDIPMRALFEVMPLCFTLLAELSLKKRRQRLEDLDKAFDGYAMLLPKHLPHGHVAYSDFEKATGDEEDSIASNDLFGAKLPEDDWSNAYQYGFDPQDSNPFFDFLRELADDLEDEIVELEGVNLPSLLPEYSVCDGDFGRLTSGDQRARFALLRGYAHVADIPQKLRGDDASAERTAWLADRVPEDKWVEEEKRNADFSAMLADLGIDDLLPAPKDTPPSATNTGDV